MQRLKPYQELKLVRIKELSKILSVSTRTIENWIREKRISVIRFGGVNLFDPYQVILDLKEFEERPSFVGNCADVTVLNGSGTEDIQQRPDEMENAENNSKPTSSNGKAESTR